MLSPEPSSPPPRRRRRRAPRNEPVPPPDDILAVDSPLDLATAFHGLAPVQAKGKGTAEGADGAAQGKVKENERGGRVEREGDSDQQRDKVKTSRENGYGDVVLTPGQRQPQNPLHQQLDPALDASSSSSLALPPAKQTIRIRSDSPLTPLSSTSSSASVAGQPGQADARPPAPIPPPHDSKFVSPRSRLRTHGRDPNPLWAAAVLEPIVRAQGEQAQRNRLPAKGKGRGGEGAKQAGWPTHGAGDEGVALSVDEFFNNVLPITRSMRHGERDEDEEDKPAKRKGKGKGKQEDGNAAKKRARRSDTTSEDGNSSSSSRLFQARDFRYFPTPKPPPPLYNGMTFFGAADLERATSKDKARLLRHAPYKTPGGGKEKLSLAPPSHTIFGQEDCDLSSLKRKRAQRDEEHAGVKRLKPGQDVRGPFLARIGQTAFAPLLDKPGGRRKQVKAEKRPMRSMLELDEEVDRIAEAVAQTAPPALVTDRRKKLARMVRPGGGKVTALELAAPEEAGVVGETSERRVFPSFLKPRPTSRKPLSGGLKYRFVPQRLPPPRYANPNPPPRPATVSTRPKSALHLGGPTATSSDPSEKVDSGGGDGSSSSAKPVQASRPPRPKPKQTDFRFITGPKARKAPTVEIGQAAAASSSSTTLPPSVDAVPPPAQARSSQRFAPAPIARNASRAFVTPAAGAAKRGKAESDPEGDEKRKKRKILRRLSTRPDFYLPSAIVEEGSVGGASGAAVHPSSHEFSGESGLGRSASLPPELDSHPAHLGNGSSPSRRLSVAIPISPNLFAGCFPPAGQSRSLPGPSGYAEEEPLSSEQEAETLLSGDPGKDGVAPGGFPPPSRSRARLGRNTRPHSPGLPFRFRLPSLSSNQSSPLWSRVPSFRQTSVAAASSAAEPVRGDRLSGLYDPVFDSLPVPSDALRDEGVEDEEQPPASVLGNDGGLPTPQRSVATTSPASDGDLQPSFPSALAASAVQQGAAPAVQAQKRRLLPPRGAQLE
ncbi:hypothetical protein JCM10213_007188 [Rhodosporidiobolus nylandii]